MTAATSDRAATRRRIKAITAVRSLLIDAELALPARGSVRSKELIDLARRRLVDLEADLKAQHDAAKGGTT